jgi:hypothetical protein
MPISLSSQSRQGNILQFPSSGNYFGREHIVDRRLPCPQCGPSIGTLRSYPLNRAVAWFFAGCGGLIRERNRLFIPHAELRASGIDPDRLPEIAR